MLCSRYSLQGQRDGITEEISLERALLLHIMRFMGPLARIWKTLFEFTGLFLALAH